MSAQTSPDPFWKNLARFGTEPALIRAGSTISYNQLASLADEWVAQTRLDLGDSFIRPLVLIEADNSIAAIASYLGTLRAGWPVILSEPGAGAKSLALQEQFGVNVSVNATNGAMNTHVIHAKPVDLHEDLRVLLSTSGTTGSAKLVRLSQRNLVSNCDGIVSYLGLTDQDRAISSLPWFYSYGMSVLHTTLATGGAFVLSDASLVDDAFWETARATGSTVLPLVPMQFDILKARNFQPSDLPSLRLVTQAGGKLDQDQACEFAEMTRQAGVKFFVMYGQTEAAPRMAYVPQDAPLSAYGSIGVPVPGGRFEILDAQGKPITKPGESGALVYSGENVMMGYATRASDLAKSQGPRELDTGDIAEWTNDGFVRIVGRASRFVKLNGLRIGLDELETQLRADAIPAWVTGDDSAIAVFVTRKSDLVGLRNKLARTLKIGAAQITVTCIAQVPTLPSGKVDYRGLATRAKSAPQPAKRSTDLQDVLMSALRTQDLELNKSFREHGGDSLSYLEVELALGAKGVAVPEAWDDLPLKDLLALRPVAKAKKQVRQAVPLDVILRILAISAIVANHATTWTVGGGAYFLLVLSGYSIARFQSTNLFGGRVAKAIGVTLLKTLVLYYLLMLAVHIAWKPVGVHWWTLVGNYDATLNGNTKVSFYWYISAFAQIVALMCVPFFFAAPRRWISANPYLAGCTALALVAIVFQLIGIYEISADGRLRHTIGALELATLGWCLFFAKTLWQKHIMAVVVIGVLGVHWIDASPSVLAFIAMGALSLAYGFRLALSSAAARVIAFMGTQTLMIYLLHPIVLSGVQRVGLSNDAPHWSNASLFGVTFVVSVGFAIAATAVIGRIETPIATKIQTAAHKFQSRSWMGRAVRAK